MNKYSPHILNSFFTKFTSNLVNTIPETLFGSNKAILCSTNSNDFLQFIKGKYTIATWNEKVFYWRTKDANFNIVFHYYLDNANTFVAVLYMPSFRIKQQALPYCVINPKTD